MSRITNSASPHLHSSASTTKIMLCVLLALLPAAIAGCMSFGRHAVLLLVVTTGTAVFLEFFTQIILRREQSAQDLSAAVTGLLLGMCLPPALPFWQAALGSAFAVVVVKQIFGGIGKNFANPAATAWILMLMLFHGDMTAWVDPLTGKAVSAANALDGSTGFFDLLLGNTAGNLGETCAAGLLLGCIFLCLTSIISPVTPVTFLGSFALLSWTGGYDVLSQLLSGGLLLGACFMANDYTTTPLTRSGKAMFGLGCGILTFIIRHFGGYPDGTLFAIVIMNLLTPLLDRMTAVKPFGVVTSAKPAAETDTEAV